MVSMKLLLVAILVVAAAGSPDATAQGVGVEFRSAAGGVAVESGSASAAQLGAGQAGAQGAGGVGAGLAHGAVNAHV